jgi:DNA polymerase III subunit epsilon
MKKFEEEEFICIDCETTGLDPKQDRVIEVAAVRFSLNTIFEEYESLVNPGCEIPQLAMEITRITPEMLVGKPSMELILPDLLRFIGDGIIVGHGVHFDMEVINSEADRAGIPCKLRYNRYIDTLRMARLYGESPTNSLEQLRQHFNIGFEGAHRAKNDVIVNMEVFKFLAKQYKSLNHLFEVLSRPVFMKVMPLGKYKGRQMKEVPIEFLLWAANKDFDQDLLYSIRSEIKRRKKGGSFNQSANPFSEL